MRETRGSQTRESYTDAGYRIVSMAATLDRMSVVLEDETGKRELWRCSDGFAGYVVTIGGIGYEFIRTLSGYSAPDR